MKIACRRSDCNDPATVATRLPSGAVDEHLCEPHAREIIEARIEALNQARYIGTTRPFAIASVVWMKL